MRAKRKLLDFGIVCMAGLLLAACGGGEKPSSPASGAPAKAGPASVSANAARASAAMASTAKLAPSAHRSIFSSDPKLKDPFFPKRVDASKAATTAPTTAAPMNLAALLQAGFQGTIGTGKDRLGLLNNVILEPGRTVEIPLNAPGQKRAVIAKVQQVLPNEVVLEVQNPRQTITVTRNQR